MIARDNATRVMLNEQARLVLQNQGTLAARGVMVADEEFAAGDRVIARRNDRYRDVDNGTLGRVESIDRHTGAMTVVTDSDERRLLDASYVADHLEHAHALTGHGAHGATVEWAGAIGRPSEFTREWAYASLSRARTRVHVITEATRAQREREQYAPPEPERTSAEALEVLTRAMRRQEAEVLALQQVDGPDLAPTVPAELPRTPNIKRAPAPLTCEASGAC
jgi:ATP-dependent exoDNAse (exonuclease V) alpha subunit